MDYEDEPEKEFFTEEQKENIIKEWESNPMLMPKISKVTVNMCVGTSGEKLRNAMTVLESITNQKPVQCNAKKTIREFGIRKNEPIATKVTLRKEKARQFLEKAFDVKDHKLKYSSFDKFGNISFGIKEHIELPETEYDPILGIFGMDVNITVERPGSRIKKRYLKKSKIDKNHALKPLESMIFFNSRYDIKIVEKEIVQYY
ncbi:MAG: 50S ribosomal protein L5 [Candidatus Lokiarchaeota archaeon]|nr:50S ribosomal protein L5 [Candidatus Lokiarchaeota archaeon]